MKEHPKLLKTEMIKAVLDGRKTQTRELIKPQPRGRVTEWHCHETHDDSAIWIYQGWPHRVKFVGVKQGYRLVAIKRPYAIGDRLWVRETFALTNDYEIDRVLNPNGIFYKATHSEYDESIKWQPSIHMPRWASRIILEITKLRVERLQEISGKDTEKEGLQTPELSFSSCYGIWIGEKYISHEDPRYVFNRYWDSLYTKKPEYQFENNPWVRVIDFKVVK